MDYPVNELAIILAIIIVIYYSTEKKEAKKIARYSSFLERFYAFIIDILIIFGVWVLILIIGDYFVLLMGNTDIYYVMLDYWNEIMRWLFFAISGLYYATFESSKWQATIGKKVMEIKLISQNGKRITLVQSIMRYLTKILSLLGLGFGIWAIFFDPKKQAFHDKLASTLVVANDLLVADDIEIIE